MNKHRYAFSFAIAALAAGGALAGTTYHVAVTGNDDASGSATQPLRTIQRAADLAQPGDTVLVSPGIYRERVAPPRGGIEGLPIVYRSEKPHAAIVRGSDIWQPPWRQEAPGIWSGEVDEALFTDTAHRDGANPFEVPLSSTPGGRDGRPEHERGYSNSDPSLSYSLGQVFVDDQPVAEAPAVGEFRRTPGTWHYDAATRRLAIHFADDAPTTHAVELTTKRRLFAPHLRQLGHITVEGFVFERCGNQYPTNFWQPAHAAWQQAGAVGTRSGRHWTIRGNIIRFATGIGLDCGNEGAADVDVETGDNGRAVNAGHHLIEANHIIDNGGAGTASYNGTHLTIRGNVVERNNRLRFTGKKRWESAGIKLHNPAHSVIEHNLVRDNYGKWGIWLDQGAGQDTRVVGNVVISQGVGIDFEIGSARPALVTDNILIANDIGIGSRESGGLTIAHNLLLGSRKAGISFSIDHSRGGGWSAAHNHVYSNLFIGGSGPFQEVAAPDDFRSEDRRLDFNVYAMEPAERRLAIGKKPPQMLTEWQTTWQGYNGETNADLHSVAQPGSSYRFDPATLRLELEIAFNPAAIGALPIAGRTADFLGQPLAAERPAPVGPFRELIRGKNIFSIWNGPPPLADPAH